MKDSTQAIEESSEMAQTITTEREMFIHWLLRCYHTLNRPSWGEGWTDSETSDALVNVLANIGYDPNLSPQAKELLSRKPVYYVDEVRQIADEFAPAFAEMKRLGD